MTASRNITTTITVSDRLGALEACAARFKDHLIDVPGVTLSAALRLEVARCARDAVTCKMCQDKLPHDTCLKPGTRVYDLIAAIEHPVSALNGVVSDKKAESVITTIVHSFINHQGRLDRDWYDDCIQALSQAKIVPESVEGEQKRLYLEYSAFAEIMCVLSMSHCINLAFLTMGRAVPRLPSNEEIMHGKAHIIGPLLLDWSMILKKAPARDPSVAFAYYFKPGDVDTKNAEYLRISEGARKAMSAYGDPGHVCLCAVFAAEDILMLSDMNDIFYMPAKDVMALFKTKLDPALRCADQFDRYDAEFISYHVAATNECAF